jgi:hypothetical protein
MICNSVGELHTSQFGCLHCLEWKVFGCVAKCVNFFVGYMEKDSFLGMRAYWPFISYAEELDLLRLT